MYWFLLFNQELETLLNADTQRGDNGDNANIIIYYRLKTHESIITVTYPLRL